MLAVEIALTTLTCHSLRSLDNETNHHLRWHRLCPVPCDDGSSKGKSGDGNTEQLVLRLENEGREATLKNDLLANDRLLADNWINVNADGSVTTKAKLMELLKAGSFAILSIETMK